MDHDDIDREEWEPYVVTYFRSADGRTITRESAAGVCTVVWRKGSAYSSRTLLDDMTVDCFPQDRSERAPWIVRWVQESAEEAR